MSTVKRLPMSMLTVLPDVVPTVKCDCFTNRPSIGHIPNNDSPSSEVPAVDVVKISQADENGVLPNGELATAKYVREIGYWSPPKYPSFKSPKQKKTTAPRKRESVARSWTCHPPKSLKKNLP